MKKNRIALSLIFLFLSSLILAQSNNDIASSVNRIYKFDAGYGVNEYFKGALELSYRTPFRIRQKNDFPEITESYNLDSMWEIPQCQQYISLDSCHGGNLIFVFELWTKNDTVTLEFLKDNQIIESKDYVLTIDEWPKSSNLDLIEGLRKLEIKANHKYREFQHIDHFSIYTFDTLTNKQTVKTGIINTDDEVLEVDTIDIKTMSAISITPTIWAARGYSKPEQYGVTSLFYGKTDSIGYQESWKRIPIENMNIQNIFIENQLIHVLTSQGIYLIVKDSLVQDESFKFFLETQNTTTFHGIFKHEGKTAVIFNQDILVKQDRKWKSIYKFSERYKYECTAISFEKDSIYFVADRKLWLTNSDTTFQIRPDIKDIMSISKGPGKSILYKQGKLENNCDHGGIYFIESGENVTLKREYLSAYPDLTINNIFYMDKTNKIVVTSYPSVYEFELDEWMKKDDNK